MKNKNHKTYRPNRRHHVSALQRLTMRALRFAHRVKHDTGCQTFSAELAFTKDG